MKISSKYNTHIQEKDWRKKYGVIKKNQFLQVKQLYFPTTHFRPFKAKRIYKDGLHS